MALKQKLFQKIEAWRPRIKTLVKDHGDVKIDDVTIEKCIVGARDVKSLVTDISYLDAQEGIRFRGMTIPEVMEKLPKVPGSEMPYVEGHFYLLLTGDIPTKAEVEEVSAEFKKRAQVPQYVYDVLRAMPRDSHPMAMFSAAIVAMQRESIFAKKYGEGMNKNDYWDPTYEDAISAATSRT
jgi:citrate synthase